MPTDPHRAPRKQSLRGWNLGGVSYPLRWMVVLTLVPSRNKVPHLAAEYGCYLSSRRGTKFPSAGGVAQSATGGGLSPESLAKGETRVTSNPHLQYRREAIATTIGATIESLFAHIGVSFTWTAPICIG